MSELTFCKSFLSALDARPSKLSSDHIADARQYPAQGAYTLHRLPHPPHPQRPNPKPSSSTADNATPTSSTSLSISLKPMKPSTPTITLSSIDASKTSVYDLKQQYATQTSLPTAKIKILYKKKPVADSKIMAEVIGGDVGEANEVEFGVMVMGGAVAGSVVGGTPVASPPAVAPPMESEKGLASAGETMAGEKGLEVSGGKEVVATDEFWGDLKNFVLQRTKDEAESERLMGVFKGAWEQNK